jgi:2-polyprenyl-3-methyl-5-hydroxy-6-metoxy-1,4-benzoquinol methylase
VKTRAHHANTNLESRRGKARKIIAVLERERGLLGADVLDIGTGAGVIASLLSEAVGAAGSVESVDVVDVRVVTDGYTYQQVEGTKLPFPDDSFDAVVSNHVIEHTGDAADQRHHLSEITRTLRRGGVAYLAVPNRYGPVEPHFKLPLLSWLPARLADAYVRTARRGTHYDCRLLTHREVRTMAAHAGLRVEDHTILAMRLMRELEQGGALRDIVLGAPRPMLRALHGVLPTFVYVLRRADD